MQVDWMLNFRSPTGKKVDKGIADCMDNLEQEVLDWMTSCQAWDERKHAAILQFIRDIKEHCVGLNAPGAITISAINVELHRLEIKVNNPGVNARIAELQLALQKRKIVKI